MLYKLFLKIFVPLIYYVKIPRNINTVSEFIKDHVKTSIKHHLIKSLKLAYDNDVYIFHVPGLFTDELEIEFAKKAFSKKSIYRKLLFWFWYNSLKIFLNQSNILTTFIYIKDQDIYNLVCIAIEYKTRNVHYLLSILINYDEFTLKNLYSFKYIDVIVNALESNCKIICIGYKTDLFKIGLGAEKYSSHLDLLDSSSTTVNKSIDFADIVIRFLSTI